MISVRSNVFETNSSSTHSLTICKQSDYDDWKNDKVLFLSERQGFYKVDAIYDLLVEEKAKWIKDHEEYFQKPDSYNNYANITKSKLETYMKMFDKDSFTKQLTELLEEFNGFIDQYGEDKYSEVFDDDKHIFSNPRDAAIWLCIFLDDSISTFDGYMEAYGGYTMYETAKLDGVEVAAFGTYNYNY